MKMRNKKGFTLAELVTAIAILVMIVGFTTVIFRSSIDSYRTAGANTEIMQKLRAITEQLNSDFEGLCKDGYLIIRKETKTDRIVYSNYPETRSVQMDRIYYFSTGDFQSWNPDLSGKFIKSNIARVFWGHSSESLAGVDAAGRTVFLSKYKIARNVLLLTPDPEPTIVFPDDCNNISFAQCKADLASLENPDTILNNSVSFDEPNNLGSFMCEGVGEFRIGWTDGSFHANGELDWRYSGITAGPNDYKPKAIKFTFTLYDSKRILDGGRPFSHIVYLGE